MGNRHSMPLFPLTTLALPFFRNLHWEPPCRHTFFPLTPPSALPLHSLRTADEDASLKAMRIAELEGLVRQLNGRLEEEKVTRQDVEHR